jgi:hypothetical protein
MSQKETDYYKKWPLNEQYAHWCAMAEPEEYDRRYRAGLEDFLRLISIDGVEAIGINWENAMLSIGTASIRATDSQGQQRVLGHYLIIISGKPAGYKLESLTPVDGYAHPHASQFGEFCMSSGNLVIKKSIIDGKCSVAVTVLMRALKYDPDNVLRGSSYKSLNQWPLAERS